jgi:fumarylacetoacetate (FAA) hydrolase family protein
MKHTLTLEETLPQDAADALLVGRAWLPGDRGGPTLVTVRDRQLRDISRFQFRYEPGAA